MPLRETFGKLINLRFESIAYSSFNKWRESQPKLFWKVVYNSNALCRASMKVTTNDTTDRSVFHIRKSNDKLVDKFQRFLRTKYKKKNYFTFFIEAVVIKICMTFEMFISLKLQEKKIN